MSPYLDLGANEQLIGRPGSRELLATPALLLDLDVLDSNLRLMSTVCGKLKLGLRPHAKTHKSSRIARMQVAAGALGVCVATVREAEAMLRSGISGVHLSSPIVNPVAADYLAGLLDEEIHLSAVIDSKVGLAVLEDALRKRGVRLHALVDVDLGSMYRTGVASPEALLELAVAIDRSDVLDYQGVQFYSGIVQHVPDAETRGRLYGAQLGRLEEAIGHLNGSGLSPPIVTGGGTGTFLLDAASGLMTENQAGSYVFMDMEYEQVDSGPGMPESFGQALSIQCSVVSNNAKGLVTVDAGSKAFATDGPLPRILSGAPGDAVYQSFGDEFGAILLGELARRLGGAPPDPAQLEDPPYELFHRYFGNSSEPAGQIRVGAKIELMVPHCDPTINLHRLYHCVRGDTLVDIWPVDGRGPL